MVDPIRKSSAGTTRDSIKHKRKQSSSQDPKPSPKAKSSDPQQPNKKRKTAEVHGASSSKEAHAKQRQQTKDRKLAKPNANEIDRAKKLWERLRRKSHVPLDERKKLVTELFDLIQGRVRDFVFKHDSVRTVQTALKYAVPEQRKWIAKELKGDYRTLAEGRYSKFLVAKIMVQGDKETREMVITEFYGHVKRLINHPEASWILDDSYRQLATPSQKARLLREWYGPEYSTLRTTTNDATADLHTILSNNPEKKRPTLQHLHNTINALIQKKMTAFTMLHDAMLQYSLAIADPLPTAFASGAPTEAISDWLTLLRPDEDADLDLLKNLAFTPAGVRVVTRALAIGTAKDRRAMLRAYKDHIETIACDTNACHVLLAAYEVVDDTKAVAKLIFRDLLASKIVESTEREAAVAAVATHTSGRLVALWPCSVDPVVTIPKWLVQPTSFTATVVTEIREIKAVAGASKKDDTTRRTELLSALLSTADGGIFQTITHKASELAASSYGCQFMAELLLHAGDAGALDDSTAKRRDEALVAIAELATGDLGEDGHAIAGSTHGGRLLKTLAQGGAYNTELKTTRHVEWLDAFPKMLWERLEERVVQWATGSQSFVVVALAENGRFEERDKLVKALKREKKALDAAAKEGNKGAEALCGIIGG